VSFGSIPFVFCKDLPTHTLALDVASRYGCSNYITGESVWAQVSAASAGQNAARKQSLQYDNVQSSSSRRCSLQSNSAAATSTGGSSSDSEDELHSTQAYRCVTLGRNVLM
jgi:hypothetical protein